MHTSLFTLAAGLCALVLATPEQAKRQNPSLASVLAEISSLQAELAPPSSIAAELTGVPASVTAALNDPSAIAVLQSQIIESGFPSWYSALPSDAQSYVLGVAAKAETIIPEIVSLEIAAGLTTTSGVGTGTAPSTTPPKTTSYSNSTITTTSKVATTSALVVTTKATSSSAAPSSSSKAAAPTNVVSAGILGAVGFLGLAVAL